MLNIFIKLFKDRYVFFMTAKTPTGLDLPNRKALFYVIHILVCMQGTLIPLILVITRPNTHNVHVRGGGISGKGWGYLSNPLPIIHFLAYWPESYPLEAVNLKNIQIQYDNYKKYFFFREGKLCSYFIRYYTNTFCSFPKIWRL